MNAANKSKSVPANSTAENIKVAVIMYHGFCTDSNDSTYVLNITDFENDILYLKENGFEFITASDYINFCMYAVPLPEKPVMITFDDGCLNNYTIAYPILKKHNVKAVISPIMYFSEVDSQNEYRNPSYSNLNFEEIKEMHLSGLVEFQNHSYNMHSQGTLRKGSTIATGESVHNYRHAFVQDTLKSHMLLFEITGEFPNTYVYPYGSITPESKTILQCLGYHLTLGCAEGYNYPKPRTKKLETLKRFNRSPEKSVEFLLSDY